MVYRIWENIMLRKRKAYIDLTNQKFNSLLVKKIDCFKLDGSIIWLCLCDCGKYTKVRTSRLNGSDRPTKTCGKCKTYKGIIGEYWCRLRNQSKKRNIELSVTKEYLWKLFEQQDNKCSISGINITLPRDCEEYHDHQWTASLDRIDSHKGYIQGNVQWVHKEINFMKHTLTQQELLNLCLIVTKYNFRI